MLPRLKVTPEAYVPDFTNTPYELEIMSKYSVSSSELKQIRNDSKGLHLTLSRAVELHQSGELSRMKAERDTTLTFLTNAAESATTNVVTDADDVARILRRYLEEGDSTGLRQFMLQSKCKSDQIERLIADWENETVNMGIIRMRAGNMLRNSIRRLLK